MNKTLNSLDSFLFIHFCNIGFSTGNVGGNKKITPVT